VLFCVDEIKKVDKNSMLNHFAKFCKKSWLLDCLRKPFFTILSSPSLHKHLLGRINLKTKTLNLCWYCKAYVVLTRGHKQRKFMAIAKLKNPLRVK